MALAAQALLCLLAGMFLVYTAVEFRALLKKSSKNGAPPQAPGAHGYFPKVSVLLPLYNEKLVAANLLDAVCRLDYPNFEALALDDSTDGTSEVIDAAVKKYRAKGVDVRRLRRGERTGFKAGNLRYGLTQASGELIAIFDADCLPPPDFLRKTVPWFANPETGFLQTRIAYANAGASVLTSIQAAEAYHKDNVTEGYFREGLFASLTGSSCVWRRACIDAIGGVSEDTITEDVDMGYAAQLSQWKYVFLNEPVSTAELPEAMASFRVQRQRWARGLVHNAIRHGQKLWRSPMSPLARLQAVALAYSPLLLALFYALLLISPLLALATPSLGVFFDAVCCVFLASAVFWGWMNTAAGAGDAPSGEASPARRLAFAVEYVLLFFPLSLYYFAAIVQTLACGRGEFHPTPKGVGRSRARRPPINYVLLSLEIFSFLYAAAALWLGAARGNYWVCLYAFLALGGFAMTLFFSLSDSRKKGVTPRSILITGASGSIGGALAREYAAPGKKLILQGRDRQKLEEVARDCEAKGAMTEIFALDLADTEGARSWARELAGRDLPDLIIAGAGVNTNIDKTADGEPWEESVECVKVNLLGAMAVVSGLLPGLRKRGHGQIALVSSLAAYYGLPHTPSYCAAKGALKNWGASLRGWLASEGIRVNVVLPGYVKSPMCDAMPGPKPFLWTPEKAARVIRKGLERDKARVSFPFPLNLGVWALGSLPLSLAMPIARLLGYGR